jgi:hypothetical protein
MHDLRSERQGLEQHDADFLPHRSTTKEVTLAHLSQLEDFAATRQTLIDTELLPKLAELERFKRLALLHESRLRCGVNEESLLRRIGVILNGANTLDDFVTTAGAALDLVRLMFSDHCPPP